ncbi:MAG: hypothetical protein OER95_19025, partial [Acidimicrobiia bacterium]|nr:hypothetical protein [Acidimicrobiia bacterium]
EADDGFVIDTENGQPKLQVCPIVDGLPDATSAECAINANATAVEIFAVNGLEGDDIFWIRSSVAGSVIEMVGGEHSDLFLIGDGTLTSIDGPLRAFGDEQGDVPAIPQPVVLPGENDDGAFAPSVTGGSDIGDELRIDATGDLGGLAGLFTDSSVDGLGMAPAPFVIGAGDEAETINNVLTYRDLESITADTGAGSDAITIESIHLGRDVCDGNGCPLLLRTGEGVDNVDVQSIAGETVIEFGSGDDVVTVGRPVAAGSGLGPGGDGVNGIADAVAGDTLDDIDAGLIVDGGEGDDTLDLDDTADGATVVDFDPGLITKAGLDADGVSHTAVETVHVRTGGDADVVNVRGTSADATSGTHAHTGRGDDDVYVSSVASFELTTRTDWLAGNVDLVEGPLFVHGMGGTLNRLLISDRSASAGDVAVTYDGVTLSGLAPAPIHHDVAGGSFGAGITIWSSELADNIGISGSDPSTIAGIRTLTTVNTGGGGDQITVSLEDGVDGPLILNTEEGDDVVDASASSLDLVVFGGLGSDELTTGSGDDLVFADRGRAATADGGTQTGAGGPGDRTDGGTQPFTVLTSIAGGAGDTVNAGAGGDTVIGGVGSDTVNGDADNDILIGGHLTEGTDDDGDVIDGGDGVDVIAGDNASFSTTPSAGGAPIVLILHDVATTATPASPDAGGPDTITGGLGVDFIYGQQDNDEISGGGDADTIEGNDGDDMVNGDGGQDDLIGGGSALDGVLDGTRSWVGAAGI